MSKFHVLIFTAILALGSLTYWSWNKLPIIPREVSVLRLSLDNVMVESLDPARAYSDDSLLVSSQVMEPLYQYHYLKRPYEVEPLLADGPPIISDDDKLVTIKIKKGILYHDHPAFKGKERELKAQDFELQFKRLAMSLINSPGRSLFQELVEGFNEVDALLGDDWTKLNDTKIQGIQTVDEHTLRIRLTRPEPNIIYYLALNFITPIPWEVVKHYNNVLDEVLVGTGPYIFEGYTGQYFKMTKNRKYRSDHYPTSGDRYANVQKLLDSSREGIPFIDEIRFYLIPDESDKWDKFNSKELDLLNVPKSYLPRLYDKNGELSAELRANKVELKHFSNLANRWLGFNMRDPLLGKNQHLRRAIAYAIDYDQYIKVMYQNTNLRANSILAPGISGYRPAKELRFKYDPTLAKEYLKMAGFDGTKQMPTINYYTRGNQEIHLLEAGLIKEMLESVGLKIKIHVLTFSDFLSKGRAGELMFFTDSWIFDYPDGENIMQLLISANAPGVNKSGYSNPRIDELFQKLKKTSSQEERNKIIYQMEEIVYEDLPWIPLTYESSFVLHYPGLKNFRKSSIIRNYIKYLKIVR